MKIAGEDRDKKTNLLVHDSCKFMDGELVIDYYGKFHYKKSFTKKEIKEIKQAKKMNSHSQLKTQIEVSPKEKDY